MTTLYLIIGIEFIIITILIFACINLIKRVEIAEDDAGESEDMMIAMHNGMLDIYNHMKYIDSKGMFETDDEVGQVFKELKKQIDNIKTLITAVEDEE